VLSQAADQSWDTRLKNQGYNNVLPHQQYSVSQKAVTDECGAMVEQWLAGEHRRNSEENLDSSSTTNLTWNQAGLNSSSKHYENKGTWSTRLYPTTRQQIVALSSTFNLSYRISHWC
jgi:hypothetical protein